MNKTKAINIFISICIFMTSVMPVFAAEDFKELSRNEIQFKLLEIQIHSGDTLYKFASRYLNDPNRWPELLKYNKIPSGDPNLIVSGDTLKVPIELVKDEIADIFYLKNNVRIRRKNAPAWKEGKLYQRLYPEDGIRTAEKSYAKLKYLKGERASIGENALVFLRPEKKRNNVIRLEAGEMTVKDVKVLTSSASIDPQKGSEYKAVVGKDKSTRLSVLKGKVDFFSSGEMVTVPEGFMSMAEFEKPPIQPVKLPPPPKFKEMGNLKKIESGKASVSSSSEISAEFFKNMLNFNAAAEEEKEEKAKPSVSKKTKKDRVGYLSVFEEEMTKSKQREKIHLQVSQDKKFTRIVIDKLLYVEMDSSMWKEDMVEGVYWWRVAYVNSMGVEGKYSSPIKLEIYNRDNKIEVESPEQDQRFKTKIITVKGVAEPSMLVTVNDQLVKLDKDGNFVAAITLEFGENIILVKGMDSDNNIHERQIRVEALPVTYNSSKNNIFVTVGIALSVVGMLAIMASVIQ